MSVNVNDNRARVLADLDWSPDGRAQALRALVEHAIESADDAIRWYLGERASKRLAARSLRLGAILFTAAASILPILQQIYATRDVAFRIAAAWPSVLLALAATLAAIDQFYGFSSSWARFTIAELAIRRARDNFELDWQAADAAHAGLPPTDDQVAAALARVRVFTDEIHTIVANETATWVAEFQTALRSTGRAAELAGSSNLVVNLLESPRVDRASR